MKIVTNNRRIELFSYDELKLTKKQEKEVEKCQWDSYFFYKGAVYRLSDFMYSTTFHKDWHAYYGTSYYSAIVIKVFPNDMTVIVGTATW